jgi:hypothetical protein
MDLAKLASSGASPKDEYDNVLSERSLKAVPASSACIRPAVTDDISG